MKKVLGVVLCGLMIFSIVGCSNKSDKYVGIPDYSTSNKSFHIGAWVSPPPAIDATQNIDYMTLENYQLIADSGINTIYALYEPLAWNNKVIIPKALDLCEQTGIKYYVRDSAILGLSDFDEEDLDNVKDFDYYKDYPAFAGHLVQDEPGNSQFDGLGKLLSNYQKKFESKDFYVNLFPTYGTTTQWQTNNYVEYFENYLKKVNSGLVSFDSYPLLQDGWGKTSLEESYLYNLEIAATLSQRYGAELWTFIQSMSFGVKNRTPASTGDIGFQVYTNLAYGVKGVQYFCLWTPVESGSESFGDAMFTRTGEKTAIYDYVKIINNEIQSFSNVMLSFNWKGTLTSLGSNNTKNTAFNMMNDNLATALDKQFITKSDRIESVTNNEDVIIGTFKDANDYDGFMLVNYSDPGKKLTSKVKITFNDATKALVYDKGIRTIVELNKGVYEVDLASGAGQFIIPYND
jgi:hypothetical protein